MNYEPRTMNRKILVADESPTVRNVTESLLRKRGYEVFFADDGVKAKEAAKANKPDLIFLDDSLSILNGEHLCKELKQNENLKDIPVIVFLSGDEVEKKQKLTLIGADAFIIKPFNPKEILDHVERLFPKEKTSSSKKEVQPSEDLSKKAEKSDKKKTQRTAAPVQKQKSEDVLDIVETSDLVEDFEASTPTSDGGLAHGFDWFLSELRKDTQKQEEAKAHPENKQIRSEQTISDKKTEHKKESEVYKIDEHQKGYEDFLKELKEEVEDLDIGTSTPVKPSTTEQISPAQFVPQFSDLKERIAERIAQEVAKKITPEFLEKIIREEIAKLGKDSS